MKKPTTTCEKVIIKPRPPKDATQEGPVVSSPADTTAAPASEPVDDVAEDQPAEEE